MKRKMKSYLYLLFLAIMITALAVAMAKAEVELQPTPFDQARAQLRYDARTTSIADQQLFDNEFESDSDGGLEGEKKPGQKSAFKAFALSLAVPGLGQFYYGSKTKAAVFAAVEAASWIYNIKLNNDGDDLTDEFEAFNREHWSRADYTTYITWTYGETDDKNITAPEMSHHLPDTYTQQYYEMTGKYDQFAWGWDDANFEGNTLYDYNDSDNKPPRAITDIPASPRRDAYETMRHNANNKYDKAKKMIAVAMVNHVLSAFEALYSVGKMNKKNEEGTSEFSRVKLTHGFRSVYSFSDTPYMKLSYRF